MSSKELRVRSIIQKHMDALSREIAQELVQPFLEQWGFSPEVATTPIAATEAAVPKALLYDKRSRTWMCPRCVNFSNLNRRSVTTHLRFCTAEPAATSPEPRQRKPRRQRKKEP